MIKIVKLESLFITLLILVQYKIVLDANQESIHAKHAQQDIIYNRLQAKKVYNIFVNHV
jgi:hypothetical protein